MITYIVSENSQKQSYPASPICLPLFKRYSPSDKPLVPQTFKGTSKSNNDVPETAWS